jgi:hypothetical protein
MLAHLECTHRADTRPELAIGAVVVRFETSEPSPNRWVAVGSVLDRADRGDGERAYGLIVGTGHTEDEAIADLRLRAARWAGDRGAAVSVASVFLSSSLAG